jgi:cytosine/adenosine deaminase-related metal-dependent hydrolase
MLGYWRLRRQRRRQQSTDNDAKVATAWAEAGESIDLGFEQRRAPYETRTEFAGRLLDQRTPGAELMQQLSELSTVARFHPTSVTEAQAGQAAALAEQVDAVVKEKVPIQTRVKRQLDPRRLVTSPHQARHVASETGRIRSLQGDEKGELVDLTR